MIRRPHRHVESARLAGGAVELVCSRCGRSRLVPLVGPPRQASVAEAVARIQAAGVVLISESVLRELEMAWRVERMFTEMSHGEH